jgi:hypothetical protein
MMKMAMQHEAEVQTLKAAMLGCWIPTVIPVGPAAVVMAAWNGHGPSCWSVVTVAGGAATVWSECEGEWTQMTLERAVALLGAERGGDEQDMGLDTVVQRTAVPEAVRAAVKEARMQWR